MEEKNSEKKERKMRDSGIPWIGEVPEGWKIPKLKYLAVLTNGDRGKNYPSGNDLVDEGVYFFTSNNLHSQILDCSREKSKFITEARYNILGGAKIRLNDILFCLRGSVGAAAINKTVESGTIASSLVCITPQNVDADFLNYCLQSNINVIQTNLFMNGSCAANLSAENVGNYYIIEPPISEQHRIADFLDSKCSEIDTLIENLRARVESAKEYKKTVITEAVTKGLDKDAKMKDSGVEWIGEIPEGWSFPKITHILDYTHPYPIGDGDHGSIKATDYTEYGIPFIRVQNLGFATDLCLNNVVYISEAQNRTIQNSTLKPNDILFAKTGATIGKVGIVPESIKKANTTSHVGKITVSESIVPKYIFYVLSSNIGYRQFWDIAAQKSTRPELSIDEIKTIRVLLPKTKEEQQQIADYLDSKCSEIDALLQNYEDQIATLEEYKKSLIYEYVTGKKEVSAA